MLENKLTQALRRAFLLALLSTAAMHPAWAQNARNPADILADKPYAADSVEDKNAFEVVSDWGSNLVISAMSYLDIPYHFGGTSRKGFDCSGFTSYVYAHVLGLQLPRSAAEQANMANMQNISQSDLQPGDLVFFNTMKRAFSHVGIYIGDNRFIHAPRSGSVVRVESMNMGYWQQRFNGARRAIISASSQTSATNTATAARQKNADAY
jgi:cell wall-associated NlpC family hydrolase